MSISEKIGAQIRRAKSADPAIHIGDFQVRVDRGGAVLINLKTGEAKLLREETPDFAWETESIIQ